MQLTMLKTLFAIVEYHQIFKQQPPVNENQTLFTRRWIRAANKGRDILAQFVGFRVVVIGGHTCVRQGQYEEISRLQQLGAQQLATLSQSIGQEEAAPSMMPQQAQTTRVARHHQPGLVIPNFDYLGPPASLEEYAAQQCTYIGQELQRLDQEAHSHTNHIFPQPPMSASYETATNPAAAYLLEDMELPDLADTGQLWFQAGITPDFLNDFISPPMLDHPMYDQIQAGLNESMEWTAGESQKRGWSPEGILYDDKPDEKRMRLDYEEYTDGGFR